MKLGLIPDRQRVRRGRQRQKGTTLDLVEPLERFFLNGAVDSQTGSLEAPQQDLVVRLEVVPEGAPGQEVAGDVMHVATVLRLIPRSRATCRFPPPICTRRIGSRISSTSALLPATGPSAR